MSRVRSIGPGITVVGPQSFTRSVGAGIFFATGKGGTTLPVVTSVTPATGSTNGGTAVTITGKNFTGATAVTFGGVAATSVVVVSTTTITCRTPAKATGAAVTVAVTTPSGTGSKANAYQYLNYPFVTSVSPSTGSAAGGTSVTITGRHFSTPIVAVHFGATAATTVVRVSTTSITCKTPAHAAGAVSVTVFVNIGNYAKATAFTYIAVPVVTSVTPGTGNKSGSTAVTIHGSHFTSASAVTFGITAATSVVVVNSTTITAVTPAHAVGLVRVSVTTPGGTGHKTTAFGYVAPLVFTKENATGTTGTVGLTMSMAVSHNLLVGQTAFLVVYLAGSATIVTGVVDTGLNTWARIAHTNRGELWAALITTQVGSGASGITLTKSANGLSVAHVVTYNTGPGTTTPTVTPAVHPNTTAASTNSVTQTAANPTDTWIMWFTSNSTNATPATVNVGNKRDTGHSGPRGYVAIGDYSPGTIGPHTVTWTTPNNRTGAAGVATYAQ